MQNNWISEYMELKSFISRQPEIEIEANRIVIPEKSRPLFYELFDKARKTFINEKRGTLLNNANLLSQNYLSTESTLMGLLSLEEICLENRLRRFLNNPIDQLMQNLFDPLFNLLKERTDIEEFENEASQAVAEQYKIISGLGYEKWILMSLVLLLEPDKFLRVKIEPVTAIDIQHGPTETDINPAEESKQARFEYMPDTKLMVPDMIIHSKVLNKFVSIKSEMNIAHLIPTYKSEKREWLDFNRELYLTPGLSLTYIDDDVSDISLVSYVEKICKPDLIIECRAEENWHKREGLNKVKLRHDTLKPRLGTYIISKEVLPEQALEGLEDGINILAVRFNQSELRSIVDVLARL